MGVGNMVGWGCRYKMWLCDGYCKKEGTTSLMKRGKCTPNFSIILVTECTYYVVALFIFL